MLLAICEKKLAWQFLHQLATILGPGSDQEMLLHLYRSLIRSKLDYGCVVYGSVRPSYLRMLDPIQNHALWLCLGAFRTSPTASLRVVANEPPLELCRH